jgi:hypothetical protein
LYCNTVNILDEALIQRVATEDDLRQLDNETLVRIFEARRVIHAMHVARN